MKSNAVTRFFERRRLRRDLKELCSHAEAAKAMREDLMPPVTRARLESALATARAVLQAKEAETLRTAAEQLNEAFCAAMPPKPLAAWRNNFEVLVVALAVAMAFRAYFYQPFKIPTGSMQPTLYGIQSREQDAPMLMDRLPFKAVKWLITSEWYREVRVGAGGEVFLVQDERKPGYATLRVAGRHYYIPADAVRERGAVRVGRDSRIATGALLWSGVVTAGDFVFVNRWRWHFFRPRRGDVMVFSTQGIHGLPPGTHYIKRMCGMPNETLAIDPPELLIDGVSIYEPAAIGRQARLEKLAPWAPPYNGFSVIGQVPVDCDQPLRRAGDTVTLGPGEYYALGDNTHNSRDSRYWGSVPARNLLGPATLVYWPFTSRRWGWID